MTDKNDRHEELPDDLDELDIMLDNPDDADAPQADGTDEPDDADDSVDEQQQDGGTEPQDSEPDQGQQQPQHGEPQPKTPGNFDKGLQKLQQQFARSQRETEARLRSLQETLLQRQDQNNQQRNTQDDELDAILKDEMADETSKRLARMIQKEREERGRIEQQVQQASQQYGTQFQKMAESQVRTAFSQAYPQLAGKFDDLRDEVTDLLDNDPDANVTPEARRVANRFYTQQVIQRHLAEAQTPRPQQNGQAAKSATSTPAKPPPAKIKKGSISPAAKGAKTDDEFEQELINTVFIDPSP